MGTTSLMHHCLAGADYLALAGSKQNGGRISLSRWGPLAHATMTKYITATVIAERFIEENRSLFVQGDRLALLIRQLSACDRETVILERETSHLEDENRRLRLQIRQRDVEIYRLRAVAQLVQQSGE